MHTHARFRCAAAGIALFTASCVTNQPDLLGFKPDDRTYDEVVAAVRAYESIPSPRDAEVILELTRNKNTNPPLYALELSRRLLKTDKSEALYFAALHPWMYDLVPQTLRLALSRL